MSDIPTQTACYEWILNNWPDTCTPIWRAAKLCEEAGEVMGAVIKLDEGRKTIEDVRMEVAQVFICSMAVAEVSGFDLYEAVMDEWERCNG